MARIRTIKPEFWEDEKVAKLPLACRLLYIGCWNYADDFGIIKGNPLLVKSQIFPYDENLRADEVKQWLDLLADARMLIPFIYLNENYFFIRTFHIHQKLDKRYDRSYVGKEFAKDLVSRIMSDESANTPSSRRIDVGNTPQEMEMEKDMEVEKEMETEVEVEMEGNGNEEEERRGKGKSPAGDAKKGYPSSPLSPDYVKFLDWLKTHTPYCYKKMDLPTSEEFSRLKGKFTGQQISEIVSRIENRKDLRKHYTSLYRTILNWGKREHGK